MKNSLHPSHWLAKNKRMLHLLLPGLLPPLVPIEVPSLNYMLQRANRYPIESMDFETRLFRYFGMHDVDPLPVAAISRLAEGDDGLEGEYNWWIRMDPVSFMVDQQSVFLRGNADLDLEYAESEQLANSIRELLPPGVDLYLADNNAWYLNMPEDPEIRTHNLYNTIGHDIRDKLPQGINQGMWNRLFTEIQMLLQQSDINIARRASNRPEVDGVWFWGEGHVDVLPTRFAWQHVHTDSVLSTGMAIFQQKDYQQIPENLSSYLEQLEPGHHLWVCDWLREISVNQQIESWQELLNKLEQQWFAPLLTALREGKLDCIVIDGCDHFLHQMTRGCFWKFWRKSHGY